MKRFIASLIVVVAFTFYAIFTRGSSATTTLAGADGSTASTDTTATTQPVITGEEDDDYVVAQQTAATVAASTGSSAWADGTYTGAQASAMYGMVQVQATIAGGKITNVQVLSHPTGRNSDQINAQAVPVLTQEAVTKQSATVQVVSGATLTSNAFMQSLQSALSQA
jgi:uncharacterized protein with FMN-binding domain